LQKLRKAGPDIAGKTEKFKRESLVYHNKTKSLKHEKCFNVVSEKKTIPLLRQKVFFFYIYRIDG
jgi:hypothetical protein